MARLLKLILLFLCLGSWLATAAAQATQRPEPAAPQNQQPEPLPPNPPQTSSAATRKITPDEAQKLFKSVDEIFRFVSERTGLPIKSPVKRELTSREQLEKYINARMAEDEDAQRLKRSGIVLKKFGLLPPDFNIESYIVQLYREQVAGYYDPKTKTVYLLDWVDPDLQKPVLAHELTHALQDQNFDLMKWADWNNSRHPKDLTAEVAADEDRAARQAVMEGQAMVMLLEYTLAPMGRTVQDSPLMVNAIKAGMLDAPDSPIFSAAPLYLREALTFAYRYGLDFTRTLLETRGKNAAFASVFRNPPTDTRQIMVPTTYMNGERVPPIHVEDFGKVFGADYERYDMGSIGQFDTMVMLKTYASEAVSERLSPQWRGGYYYAAARKRTPGDNIALVYVSKWADEGSARDFAKSYADGLPKRYKQSKPIYTGGAAVSMSPDHWHTETGDVWIVQRGVNVIAIESAPSEIAARLRQLLASR